MLSISIGPLALPVAPLVLLAAIALGAWVARRIAGAEAAATAEHTIWVAAALALLAARAGHLVWHADAYLASPWAMLDFRDGGWFAPAGVAGWALWLAWRGWRSPPLRRPLGLAGMTAAVVWLAGSGLAAWSGGAGRSAVPDIALTDPVDGRSVRLPAALAGRPAVVNLWASWCGPCRVEMPVLARAQQRETQVRFLFVNQGESAATVRAYLEREGLVLDGVWLDRASAAGPAVGSSGLPTTLFFDASGRRVDAHFGVLNDAALSARVQQLRGR